MRILAVDDEADMLEVLEDTLQRPGVAVATERDSGRALARLREESFDLLITDLRMPGMDGLSLLRAAHEFDPGLVVLVVTAFPAVDSAIQAIRSGAFDYVTKPFDPEHLRIVVDRALALRKLAWENEFLRRQLAGRAAYEGMVGRSAPMRGVFDLIETIAPKDANVLIVGESGTGKELVARAIHVRSVRADGNFVPVDCGALPENLLESELFGHEKGAFTGAVKTSPGLLEFADGGTFFLDEVCELPLSLQAKLLRALQERQFRRVGGREMRRTDLRVLSATNRDIEREVRAERFRQDLYYRLNVVQVRLPPLRERVDDVPVLVAHFLEQFARHADHPVRGVGPEASKALAGYPWPGNVRELRNVVERAVSLTQNEFLLPEDLPTALRDPANQGGVAPSGDFAEARAECVAKFEREYLTALLRRTNGNVSQAARIGNIPRGSLHRLLRRHNLRSDQFTR